MSYITEVWPNSKILIADANWMFDQS